MKKLSFPAIYAAMFLLIVTGINWTTTKPTKNIQPTEFTVNEFIDFTAYTWIPCNGEFVDLQGSLHHLYHVTINGNRAVIRTLYQPQGITGIGQLSGDRYQATGATSDIETASVVNGQISYTYINNFRIIGTRKTMNYMLHNNFHVTIGVDGTVHTIVDHTEAECR